MGGAVTEEEMAMVSLGTEQFGPLRFREVQAITPAAPEPLPPPGGGAAAAGSASRLRAADMTPERMREIVSAMDEPHEA